MKTKGGRNILAGEIMVGTAALSIYCGGCGAYAGGALAGEISGAIGASRAKGDVLSGVLVGGALGAVGGGPDLLPADG